MEMTKLTIRVPIAVLERAKEYAENNQTSVTRLVSQYLSQLPVENDYLQDAPIVQSLIGILSPETTIEDYWRYIEEKYGDGLSNPDRS
ncbi:MAG: hypothetical protein K1X50_00110 [Candidatus Promineofilum sp.]|nr:hypothetical protein [Promineifilum sp.]MCW5861861.1 hypothetical protein [Anaerolineae bacterium]